MLGSQLFRQLLCPLIFSLLSITPLFSQTKQDRKYLLPGDTLPDHTLTDLVNFPKEAVKLSEFRGKWLIIDFWAHGCSSCIASFPRMDSLSQLFKDKDVQIIMIGVIKSSPTNASRLGPNTRNTYAAINRKYNLKGTNVFDSILYLKYDIGGLPHIMVVDPKGVIRAKTNHIDSAQIAQLLKNEMPSFYPTYSRSEPQPFQKYNTSLPLLTSGQLSNGGVDTTYVFRSLIARSSEMVPQGNGLNINKPSVLKEAIKTGKLELFRYSVASLYRLAYFGIFDWVNLDTANYKNNVHDPIVESQKVKTIDLNNEYCYSLTVPAHANREFIQKSLQQDLERYFGFKATVEMRNMPVYYLKIKDQQKVKQILKDDGGKPFSSVPENGVSKYRNMPFLNFLSAVISGLSTNIPVVDLTGINQKITVDFPSDMLDPLDVIEKMKLIGFSIEKGEKEMNAIVLK